MDIIQFAPIAFDLPLVAPLTALIATPVQVMVNISRGFFPRVAGKWLPLIGIGVGFVTSLILVVATKQPFDSAAVAQCGLASIGGQIGAMGAVHIHNRATKVDEKIQAALDAEPGTTRAEIDKAVK